MKYSFIIPVYNRPDEVDELLGSLLRQTFSDFEGRHPLVKEPPAAQSREDRLHAHNERGGSRLQGFLPHHLAGIFIVRVSNN